MKKESFLEKATKTIAWFLGSWWGVLTHTLWFTIWTILDFSIDRLTFFVSLEAIFIGIFLLMAANQAELERDKREARERAKQIQQVEEDLALDKKEVEEIGNLKAQLNSIQKDVKQIKVSLENINSIKNLKG